MSSKCTPLFCATVVKVSLYWTVVGITVWYSNANVNDWESDESNVNKKGNIHTVSGVGVFAWVEMLKNVFLETMATKRYCTVSLIQKWL